MKSSKERSKTDEKDDLDESNVVHAKIRRQAESQGWTNGPDNVRDLFLWPEFNASRLLEDRPVDSDSKVADVKRLLHLLSHDIEVHEAYGGTGNGATTLHRQITALQHVSSRLAKDCSWPAMSLFFPVIRLGLIFNYFIYFELLKVAIESCHLPLPDWNFLKSTLSHAQSHIISIDHM